MPKCKPNKSLLKRVKITKSGRVKFQRACGRHLRSGKKGSLLRSYRAPAYAAPMEARRALKMLRMRNPVKAPVVTTTGEAAAA